MFHQKTAIEALAEMMRSVPWAGPLVEDGTLAVDLARLGQSSIAPVRDANIYPGSHGEVTFSRYADAIVFDQDVEVRLDHEENFATEGGDPRLASVGPRLPSVVRWPAQVAFPLVTSVFRQVWFTIPRQTQAWYVFFPQTQRLAIETSEQVLAISGGRMLTIPQPSPTSRL